MKFILLLPLTVVLFLAMSSCSLENTQANNIDNIQCIPLPVYNTNRFVILFKKAEELLLMDYPCAKVEIVFGTISPDLRIKNYKRHIEQINMYRDTFQDSTLLNLDLIYTEFGNCKNSHKYNSSNNCQFYVDGIYHTEDASIQCISIYQEGYYDTYDLVIKVDSMDNVNIIAFG